MWEEIYYFVSTILGWELGRYIYKKVKWWYMVRQGKAAKIICKDGGIITVIGDRETVKKTIEEYS